MLMIHLKRFGFDWEAGRAIKSDDYFEASSVTILVTKCLHNYTLTVFSNTIFSNKVM